MRIEIINIGDEILIGQVVNTNAAWMAEELNRNGFRADRFTVVADDREQILYELEEAGHRAGLVLVSGGLGPTKDDITKRVVCEFFDTRLVFNEAAYRDIEEFFSGRGMPVTGLNRMQAELPENCTTLPNRMGTARGMWFEKERRTKDEGRGSAIFIFLPGVPFELKDMFTREVIPRLRERFVPRTIYHRTVLTQGMGESFMADILKDWEEKLPAHIRLAYLPQPGIVRLRFTATGKAEETLRLEVESEIARVQGLLPGLIYGYDDDTLETIVGQLLKQRGETLTIAESCTGGYLSHMVTSVPGSSGYFRGSVVAYDNRAKTEQLGVRPETLDACGAVSEPVALEMAAGVRERFRADWAIATTGIAGPAGGSSEKPVGTVWIALASPEKVFARHFLFGDNRERNIRRTALTALNLLRKEIEQMNR